MSCLSAFAVLLLPRQFHVTVTENNSDAELRRATWMFPLYLVLINLFVIPIAAAGLLRFGQDVNPDTFVLALPIDAGHPWLALFAFIGGLSAATAMVIVATVALAIMISNDIVVPLLLRRHSEDDIVNIGGQDMSDRLLTIRRLAIFGILLLAYATTRRPAIPRRSFPSGFCPSPQSPNSLPLSSAPSSGAGPRLWGPSPG